MFEVWMQQCVIYCGTVLPATRQMPATSSVQGVDAAVRHVLWCFVLQTSMDRCTQLVLQPRRNVQPVQLVVQEMAESAVADNVIGSIQYLLELAIMVDVVMIVAEHIIEIDSKSAMTSLHSSVMEETGRLGVDVLIDNGGSIV